jgi:phospholipid-translocating ATPase
MIKTYFQNRPIVMAVGDGYNDALMMQEADISVEVLNKGRKGLTFTP